MNLSLTLTLTLTRTLTRTLTLPSLGEHGRLGLGDNDKEHEAPQRLAMLSHPAVRVKAAACGRGVGSQDEGPAMLVLASPVSMDAFDAQFLRYYNA
mgnify:FL=1